MLARNPFTFSLLAWVSSAALAQDIPTGTGTGGILAVHGHSLQ